jgi:hypothetical protein
VKLRASFLYIIVVSSPICYVSAALFPQQQIPISLSSLIQLLLLQQKINLSLLDPYFIIRDNPSCFL